MALIGMVVYNTDENDRYGLTVQTLDQLQGSVNFWDHRLVLVDNGSNQMTKDMLDKYWRTSHDKCVIHNDTNLGTAKAINQVMKLREPGEVFIKIDNDIVVHHDNWVEELEEVLRIDPAIGIVGPKLKMVDDNPMHPAPFYRSRLRLLPHQAGQKWYVVEETHHIPGAVSAWSSKLMDKIGYLWQPGVYGWDDTCWAARSLLAGFKNCFLHGIDVDHIDPGGNDYTAWKRKYAGAMQGEVGRAMAEFQNGTRSLYCEAE